MLPFEDPTVEYEIVDEHGNQIMINDAEQLKQLATSVSESVQPDGSIVKEYILNDPQIIEQIRNKMKSNSMADALSNKPVDNKAEQTLTGNRSYMQSSSNISQEEVKRSQISLNKYGSQQQIQKVSPITVENMNSTLRKSKPSSCATYEPAPTGPFKQPQVASQEKFELKSKTNQQQPARANNMSDSKLDLTTTKSLPKQSHQSPAFLAQVKQTLNKFREKTSPNTSKKPPNNNTNNTDDCNNNTNNKQQMGSSVQPVTSEFQRFISSASFNDFLQNEKKYFQRENAAIQDITALSQNLQEKPTVSCEANQTETKTSSTHETKSEIKKKHYQNHQHQQQQEPNESHYLQPIQKPKVQVQNHNYQYPNQHNYQNQYVNNFQNQHQNQYHNYQNQYMNHQIQHQQHQPQQQSKKSDYENVIPEEIHETNSVSMTTNEATFSNPMESITTSRTSTTTTDNETLQPKPILSKNRKYEHKYENAISFRKTISNVNKFRTIPANGFNQFNKNYSNSANNYENVIPNTNRSNSEKEAPQPQQQSFIEAETNKPKEISLISAQTEMPALKTNDAIKHINHKEFELRTRKGKALKFTITSEDPTESDIEECKAILNQSCENLIAAELSSSDSMSSTESNCENQKPIRKTSSSSNTKPIPAKKPTNFDMPKYTASPVIIAPPAAAVAVAAPSNLKPIDSFSKLSNLSSDSSDDSIVPEPLVSIKYNRNYTKNSGSMSNLACPSKIKINGSVKTRSSNENLTNLSSFGKPLIARNNSNNNRIIINGCDNNKSSSSVETKPSNRQIIIEPSVPKPAKSEQNLCSFENYLNMANQPTNVAINDSKRVNFKMGNTYTKSTINFPTLESTKEKSQSSMNLRNIFTNNNSQAASISTNKSLDNLTELESSPNNILNGLNITPEMTQKLLLQLLLQQISSNLTHNTSHNNIGLSQQQQTQQLHDNSYSYCHYNQFHDSQPQTRTDQNLTSVTEDAFHSDCDDTISMNPISQSNFKRNNSKKFTGKMSFDPSRTNANRQQQREEYELMQNYGLDGHVQKSTDGYEKF